MLFLIVLILILAVIFGGWGSPRYGYVGWSPLVLILVVLLILWAVGALTPYY
jgi:hypothetical protein